MKRLLACAILAWFATGCSYQVKEYKNLKNVDMYVGGRPDPAGAERDAASFEVDFNKQFDSNVTMPRLPFHVGRYIASWCHEDGGIWAVRLDGEF